MNRYGHTPDDILAVKNISSQIPGQLVYLGALSAHHGGGHPGRWSTWRDAWLPTPATWDGGGVGDLLAVTTPTNVSQLATYHGRLLVLFQQGRYTHLGIARSGSLVDALNPSSGLNTFLWLEILAIRPAGANVDLSGVTGPLPWQLPGGHFIALENTQSIPGATVFRKRLWQAFGMDQPDVRRPAQTP